MNLRAIAEKDLSCTLEGDGQEITISAPDGTDYAVKGIVNDIGFATDAMGQQIAARNICCMWRLSSLSDNGRYILPDNGWKVTYTDLMGNVVCGYVTRVEPDQHIGVGRVYLSLDLS